MEEERNVQNFCVVLFFTLMVLFSAHDEAEMKLMPETQAVMQWADEIPFVLSATFHAGNLVVRFPYNKHSKWFDHYRYILAHSDTINHSPHRAT